MLASRRIGRVAMGPWCSAVGYPSSVHYQQGATPRTLSSNRPPREDEQQPQTLGRRFNIVRWMFKIDDKKEQEIRDNNAAQRERLTKQLSDQMNRGLLGDFGEMKRNNGKRFSAPDTIVKASDSPRFPSIEADTLSGDLVSVPELWHGKVTFVTIGFRAYSKQMLDGYRKAFEASFGTTSGCQLVEISVVDSFLLRTLLASSIKAALRKEAEGDDARLRNTLCYLGPDAQNIKEQLGVFNAATGYGFLVDKNGRIRWRVHGHIDDNEVKTLRRCVSELLSSSR